MALDTPISWCDSTTNPVMGCEGCELFVPGIGGPCYTGIEHQVLGRSQNSTGYAPDFFLPTLFRAKDHPNRLTPTALARKGADLRGKLRPEKPWLDRLPRLIFVSDMGDALSRGRYVDSINVQVTEWKNDKKGRARPHRRAAKAGSIVTPTDPEDGVPFDFLKEEIIDVVTSPGGQRHHWLWLSKQPQRMATFSAWLAEDGIVWPENLWAGTSVTGRGTLWRVEDLYRVGDENTIRFLSVEPMFHEVRLALTLKEKPGKWWVIAGGESRQSGQETRATELGWLRSLRDELAALGVPYFIKQLGGRLTDGGKPVSFAEGRDAGHHGDWAAWPADLRVRQMPIAAEAAAKPKSAIADEAQSA